MYQFSIPVGKSATADVTVVDTPVATELPAGTVGLMIGVNTGYNGPMLVRFTEYVIDGLIDELKEAVSHTAYEVFYDPATTAMAYSPNSTGLESSVAAGGNGTAGYGATRSELIKAGLDRCRDRFREELNAGNLPLLSQ